MLRACSPRGGLPPALRTHSVLDTAGVDAFVRKVTEAEHAVAAFPLLPSKA